MPANLATFVCKHVFRSERPVLFAYREDGMLCLMCGEADHDESADGFKVVGVGHLLERDPSLNDLERLPEGAEVERLSVADPWQPTSDD